MEGRRAGQKDGKKVGVVEGLEEERADPLGPILGVGYVLYFPCDGLRHSMIGCGKKEQMRSVKPDTPLYRRGVCVGAVRLHRGPTRKN